MSTDSVNDTGMSASAFNEPYAYAGDSSTHLLGQCEGGLSAPMVPVAPMGGSLVQYPYAGDSSAYLQGHGEGGLSASMAPVAPMGGGLVEDGQIPQLRDVGNFFANSAAHQGLSQGLGLDNWTPVLEQSPVVDQLSQQGQQGNAPGADLAPAPSLQPKKLAFILPKGGLSLKKNNYYGEEFKPSEYGPPFVRKEIKPGMSQDEIREVEKYNTRLLQERKKYSRQRNTLSARRSRERKRLTIEVLEADNQRLQQRPRETGASNHEVADTTARIRFIERDNAKLKQEMKLLRARVDDLARKLGEPSAELQEKANELAVMPSPARSHQQQFSAN
ncbi:hypothetical protein F5B17DRAFT_427347 [Nemania serpens]|nr:hypothetical protein F5B17DRAFT_427347 [Nemania serpens]